MTILTFRKYVDAKHRETAARQSLPLAEVAREMPLALARGSRQPRGGLDLIGTFSGGILDVAEDWGPNPVIELADFGVLALAKKDAHTEHDKAVGIHRGKWYPLGVADGQVISVKTDMVPTRNASADGVPIADTPLTGATDAHWEKSLVHGVMAETIGPVPRRVAMIVSPVISRGQGIARDLCCGFPISVSEVGGQLVVFPVRSAPEIEFTGVRVGEKEIRRG